MQKSFDVFEGSEITGAITVDNFHVEGVLGRSLPEVVSPTRPSSERTEGQNFCRAHRVQTMSIFSLGNPPQFGGFRTKHETSKSRLLEVLQLKPVKNSLCGKLLVKKDQTIFENGFFVGNPSLPVVDRMICKELVKTKIGDEWLLFLQMRETAWDENWWSLFEMTQNYIIYVANNALYKTVESLMMGYQHWGTQTGQMFPPHRQRLARRIQATADRNTTIRPLNEDPSGSVIYIPRLRENIHRSTRENNCFHEVHGMSVDVAGEDDGKSNSTHTTEISRQHHQATDLSNKQRHRTLSPSKTVTKTSWRIKTDFEAISS